MVRMILEERLSASVFLQKGLSSKTGDVSCLEKGLVGGTDAGPVAEPQNTKFKGRGRVGPTE
jgi:hypothetical protein